MTFLERLQANRGCLLHIKTQLLWYGYRGWDDIPGRMCLLLNTASKAPGVAAATVSAGRGGVDELALLLIDGSPQWIWVAEKDVEILQ